MIKLPNKLITAQDVKNVIHHCYGLNGSVKSLPGEIDLNFLLKSDTGSSYVVKISPANADTAYLDFQNAILGHLADHTKIESPLYVPDINGNIISRIKESDDQFRFVRLLTWIPGRLWSQVNPHSKKLRYHLGMKCGTLTRALSNFDHPLAKRSFEWDIAQSLWTKNHLELFDAHHRNILTYFQQRFERNFVGYKSLRKAFVHNDANDNNIIVTPDILNPKVHAIIDFGDAIHTQIINDVAITCAYAIMDYIDPLDALIPILKGYHNQFPLESEELSHLFDAIAMRLIISVTKSAINKQENPDNKYLSISEKPAWALLKKWKNIDPQFAEYTFRSACGFDAHPNQSEFLKWAENQEVSLLDLFPSINKSQVKPLDLSIESKWIGHQSAFNDLDLFQFKIDKLQSVHPDQILAGGYLEPRVLYTSTEYEKTGNQGSESRTIHLGIDFWLPQNTPVHALYDGEVVCAVNDAGNKVYGGLVILKHKVTKFEFFTLYGHLSVKSATAHQKGDFIKKGFQIGVLGNYPENGNWAPHLHFQIMLSMLDYQIDFPGVAYYNEIEIWKSLCPDPNTLFKIEGLNPIKKPGRAEIIKYRKDHLGKGMSLHYSKPLKIIRGDGVYLIDETGRKYLDTVNNVAHVGHEHPDIVKAGQEQMAVLNTNTRYLHDAINEFAKALIATLPDELNVIHFVNSGSEANELALRMAYTYAGQKDMIVSEVGYHGNTNACVDVSSYKFDGKGGKGTPEHTHVFPLPDSFRGKYRGNNTARQYADQVKKCIDLVHAKNRQLAGFIIESIISCGGQIELPEGFLAAAYEHVRNAGGLCIADEVQVGLGRVGKTFWGFQIHDVIPDIVTIGKPLGNGHPVAAVACTTAVADAFANGMEYFNTFGGNPVSCAIGLEVLNTLKKENLQRNALEVGSYLKTALNELSQQFPIIGHVRGQGLFLGFELVDAQMNPLAKQASYLINRMKNFGILMSTDGKDNNVIKIKPPMVFSKAHAQTLIQYLNVVLKEDYFNYP